MWSLIPFGEVEIIHEKMPTVPAIEILWKFHTFLKFTKFHQTDRIYWNHHLKHACEIWAHSEKLKFFMKNADSAGYRNIMKFPHLFKVHQISANLQNLLKSSSKTCIWNLSPFREVKFFMKKCLQGRYRNIMKIPYLFKVHQISANLQNLLESSSETCMWNLSPFGEVKIFHEKMLTVLAIEIWNFHIFSNFTKFHQTDRIYWNHHLKHACEIWVHSEKLKFFIKNGDRAGYRNIMKIPYLFKVHQISSNLQNLLVSSSETCMWNLS